MRLKFMDQVYEGKLVCRDCGAKYYPQPDKFAWLGVVDVGSNEFFTLPFHGPCAHCGRIIRCAFKLEEESNEIITVTE